MDVSKHIQSSYHKAPPVFNFPEIDQGNGRWEQKEKMTEQMKVREEFQEGREGKSSEKK